MTPAAITVVDYGVGNLASIANMIRKAGYRALISGQPEIVAASEKVILPGIGAFDHGIRSLQERNLVEALTEAVKRRGVPFLGICLGMQLLMGSSAEGTLAGLGWLAGRSQRFNPGSSGRLKVPHMGWNNVNPRDGRATLFQGFEHEAPRFYFVHSYFVQPEDPSTVLATSVYGHEFAAAVQSDNVLGVQFHPEKSHRFGLKLLENFCSRT